MFMTYRHAELLPGGILGDPRVQHWQFVEQDIHCPWFYVELVRDYGDEQVGSMLTTAGARGARRPLMVVPSISGVTRPP